MASVKPLFGLLVISLFASSAFAEGGDSAPQPSSGSVQNQTADSALFAQPAGSQRGSSDLFFLKSQPRLDLTAPAEGPRSVASNGAGCYKMRMYKVKRKERLANGENGLRGYSTCELASNYQMRSAVAHVQTLEGNESRSNPLQK